MTSAMLQQGQTGRQTDFSSSQLALEPKTPGPLLVATDGSWRSDAAVRAALKISSASGQKVLVLAVHAPLPVMGPEVQIATSPSMDAQSRVGLLGQVADQLDRAGVTDWPVKVTTGYPAATIAKLAKSIDASLIIMGLGGHGVLERVFGDELVLQVLRVGTIPVLAVADNFRDLPQRVLAAVDFSESSKRSLELGGPLVRSGGTMTLTHVITADTDPMDWRATDAPHLGSIRRELGRFAAGIEFGDGVACERRVVAGDPGKELLEIATAMGADLIVTGSHGRNFLNRLLLGSVSTQLLRKAGCSILVAPPLDPPAIEEPQARFAFYEWTERLEEFSRRNAGRRACLEVNDPETVAQVAEDGALFVSASYDPRNARVHLTFGTRECGNGHAIHNIEGVTAIQTLRDRTGKDMLLRIGHGRGRTLLTLER